MFKIPTLFLALYIPRKAKKEPFSKFTLEILLNSLTLLFLNQILVVELLLQLQLRLFSKISLKQENTFTMALKIVKAAG